MTRVTEAITRRRSIRAFLDRPVPRALLESLLETAQRAPSGGNLQPWRVILVAGKAREAVSALAGRVLGENPNGEPTDRPVYPAGLWEPYRSRRFRVGEMMYDRLGIPREDRFARLAWLAGNYRFFGAPVGLFLVIDARMGHGQWGHAGMYLQSLALLAEEAGLGSCMQECWAMLRPSLKAHFALAETEMVWCGMALGWPDPDAPVNGLRSERAELKDVAEWHGFD